MARVAFGINLDDMNAGVILDNFPADYPEADTKTQGRAQNVQYSLPQQRVQKVAVPLEQDEAQSFTEDSFSILEEASISLLQCEASMRMSTFVEVREKRLGVVQQIYKALGLPIPECITKSTWGTSLSCREETAMEAIAKAEEAVEVFKSDGPSMNLSAALALARSAILLSKALPASSEGRMNLLHKLREVYSLRDGNAYSFHSDIVVASVSKLCTEKDLYDVFKCSVPRADSVSDDDV
jgi:hypothetical protein